MIFKIFLPDEMCNSVFDMNFENRVKGIKYIIFDFDNTLMPWGSDKISEEVENLLNYLIKLNFSVSIATNSNNKRIDRISANLHGEIKVVKNLKKPFSRRITEYIQYHHIDPAKTLFIGDNLITDIMLGNRLGCRTVKVTPLSNREFWATRFYRMLEFLIVLFNHKYFKKLETTVE